MHYTTFVVAILASLAAAAPDPILPPSPVVQFDPLSTPNCSAIQDRCENCPEDDFDCESDPSCEWCFDHDGFNQTSSGNGK
ncbi:hypothetical protein F5Y15DRAFT_285461 [Xylariaceae sp. FL0016]|nr:hypothetical protein F5Y15DRAFT_285461 [Xylariaceae sp. FL0016]